MKLNLSLPDLFIIKKIANFHTKMTIFPMVNALQKSWNSYLEEMVPHTNMHNGISLKTATTLSKFSFLDEEGNTLKTSLHNYAVEHCAVCTVSSSISTRELTSCLLAFTQLISGRAPDKRGAASLNGGGSAGPTVMELRKRKDSIFSIRWWAAPNYKATLWKKVLNRENWISLEVTYKLLN